MKAIVLSLQRLYRNGKITIEQLQERVVKGTITQEEFEFIISDEVEGNG